MVKKNKEIVESNKIALFQGMRIRKVLVDGVWWFCILDIVSVLTDSANQQVISKICVAGIGNYPKGGGKLPPPFQFKHPEENNA